MATASSTRLGPEAKSVLLADGRRVTIRALRADDAPALVEAFEHADPWDLRRRFMGCPPPAAALVQQLVRADGFHDFAIGAFADNGSLVGVAQFDRAGDESTAEVAIEVAHEWQHDGLGTALLARLSEVALECGVHEFTATYYADNFAIRRLLGALGTVVRSGYDHGTGYAEIALDAAALAKHERTLTEHSFAS